MKIRNVMFPPVCSIIQNVHWSINYGGNIRANYRLLYHKDDEEVETKLSWNVETVIVNEAGVIM